MSEIQTKEVECGHCKDKIRVVFIEDIGMYFCGKLKCKLIVLIKHNKIWRTYISPNEHIKALEIIKELNEEYGSELITALSKRKIEDG